MSRKHEDLFEALGLLSVPLERSFHLALCLIKEDDEITEKRREDLLTATKAILFNSLELHEYLRKKSPKLDFCLEGKQKYAEMRKSFKNEFPSSHDEEFNLHELIDKETDRRLAESSKRKRTKD